MSLPEFIIVGAAKSGTTSLWYYLSQHPEIFVTTPKETNYFVHDQLSKGNEIKTLEQYESLFEGGIDKVKGEVSPAYLVNYQVAARQIKKVVPDCKIVILLRNPVDRVYSRYWGHWVRDKNVESDFEEIYPKLLDAEIISPAVEHYINVFSEEKVKMLVSEEMENHFSSFAKPLWQFLGVTGYDSFDLKRTNTSGKPRSKTVQKVLSSYNWLPDSVKEMLRKIPSSIRTGLYHKVRNFNIKEKPQMNPKTRKILEEYYMDEVEKLEKLSGFELKERWFSWNTK